MSVYTASVLCKDGHNKDSEFASGIIEERRYHIASGAQALVHNKANLQVNLLTCMRQSK